MNESQLQTLDSAIILQLEANSTVIRKFKIKLSEYQSAVMCNKVKLRHTFSYTKLTWDCEALE